MKTREEKRLEFHEKLCELLGSRNCYFCPPNGKQMEYPCITYELAGIDKRCADNQNYIIFNEEKYELTLIDENPDSEFVSKILQLPRCSFGRLFISDNLNHFTFTIYI